jgi:penicillin-binding protein 1A
VKQRDWGWIFKTLFLLAAGGSLLSAVLGGAVYYHFAHDLPKIITLADYRPPIVTQVIATGLAGSSTAGTAGPNPQSQPFQPTVVGEFFKNERRYLIPYEKIPQIVIQSFISAEDDHFFEHPGVNIPSMIRAAIANFRAGHVVQGGSTITQQVAKSLLLTPERSFGRKAKEIILASRIEKNLTKQQILYLYLNQIYLGHGAYGVQAASRTYFHKDISQVDIAEAALLAGLPQAPGKYSPVLNPKKAKERQLYVLKRLVENKYITPAQMNESAAEPLHISHDEDLNLKFGAYLVEQIRRYLIDKYGEKAVYEDGLTIEIPTRPALMLAAGKSLREGLREADKRAGYRGSLQKLRTPEDTTEFLNDVRAKMIEKKLHYQILLGDGTLDPVEALKDAKIEHDQDLVDPDELYQAVATGFDEKKKTMFVQVGAIKAELPLENMKWARAVKDEQNPSAQRPEPTSPSKVFQKGDVLEVRFITVSPDKSIVTLEQEPTLQGALVSMEVGTGYVLALEGGYDYEMSEFNRAIQAQRQPGSSFKPIIYAAALEKGFTPASIITDAPIVYEDKDTGKWKPNNFEEKFYGDTTFRQALIKSRNVPTIKIVQSIQVPYLIDFAKRLGMVAQFQADLSISLGSAAISPLEMTRTYALFPRLGRRVTPIFLTKVFDRDGKLLEENKPQALPEKMRIVPFTAGVPPAAEPSPGASPMPRSTAAVGPGSPYPLPDDPDQVMDPRVAYVMTNLMKEVVNYGTGHEAKNLNRAAAGKTGTTNEYIDAWFMGFTPEIISGVWVGNDSPNKSIGPQETGARAALPVWLSYMREAVKGYPDSDFPVPPGVVFATIDPNTGKIAPANSADAIREAFIQGTEPTQESDRQGLSTESQSEFFKEDTE